MNFLDQFYGLSFPMKYGSEGRSVGKTCLSEESVPKAAWLFERATWALVNAYFDSRLARTCPSQYEHHRGLSYGLWTTFQSFSWLSV